MRDIGLIGKKYGWALVIGGNVGTNPRIAQECATGLDDDAALAAIDMVVGYYRENAKKGERFGKMIDRVGLEAFQRVVAIESR